MEPAKVLTIGGSDSGGAAGIQADIKTITLLGGYAMSVVTVVTAQNSVAVSGAHFLPPEFVGQQLEAVLGDYGAGAIKTGFIGNVAIIETVAKHLAGWSGLLVVDPVLVNHRAEAMFGEAVTEAYRQKLLPLATLVTPNRAEAGVLTGRSVSTIDEMATAARQIYDAGPGAVLIKGGRQDQMQIDIFFDGNDIHTFQAPFIKTENTHGSGDTLSAAITTRLGQGEPLMSAIEQAHHFTGAAIRAGKSWQLGAGHGPLGQWVTQSS